MNFSLIDHTFLPATGSQAMNSPQLPPGAANRFISMPSYGVPAMYDCAWSVTAMQMLKMPACASPVRGENVEGCQSLPPMSGGQTFGSLTFGLGYISGTTIGMPVLRSMPFDRFWYANGCAERTSPVVRSIR